MKNLVKILPFCLALVSKTAFCNDVLAVGKSALSDFQVNGFLSIAAAWTNVEYLPSGVEPVYSTYVRKRPSFEEDSDVGLQFSKLLREDIGITVQFLATAAKEWQVHAVWAFLKWEPNDTWQFRVGKVRSSPYMLSEFIDVGYAYPWIRPPEEVYSQIPSEFSNLTGVDAQFRVMIYNRDLTFKAFYGATSSHLSFPTGLNFPTGINMTIFDTVRLWLRDVYTLNLKYGDEAFAVYIGYQTSRVTIDPNTGTLMQGLNAFLNAMALPNPLNPFNPEGIGLDYVNYFTGNNFKSNLKSIGYEFNWKNVVSMAELVKRSAQSPLSANVIGWYVMGGYRVKEFLPNITFAREKLVDNRVRRFNGFINSLFMNPFLGVNSPIPLDVIAQQLIYSTPDYDGGAGSQHSLTLGMRWDIYPGIAIKGEYKHIHPDYGTPGLFNVNPGKSANLYSVAVDAVM